MNPITLSPWLLLCLLALITPKDRSRRHTVMDVTCMTILSICGSILGSFWLYAFWLDGSVLHADFLEYCTGTSSPFLLTTGISSKRSMLPMILPRFFYEQYGVFDALAIASILSLAATSLMVGLWARYVGGRSAGYVAIATTLCLGPLCLMGHIISSYPEMSLCFIIGAATTSLAIMRPSYLTIFLASSGIGISLLADTRGLLWGLSYVGILLLRILFHRQRFRLSCIAIGTLYLFWRMGVLVYVPEAIGFEEQVDFRPMIHRVLGDASPYSPPFSYESRWVWGLVPVQEAWHTLGFLYAQSTLEIPDVPVSAEIHIARKLVGQYLYISVWTLLLCILFLRKHIWKLLALGTTVPFLIGLYGNLTMLEHHARFYLNTLPALAFLLALAWNLIGWKSKSWYVVPCNIVVWTLVLLGILQTPMSPTAKWQHRFSGSDPSFSGVVSQYQNGFMDRKADLRHCYRALQSLELDQQPLKVQIFD